MARNKPIKKNRRSARGKSVLETARAERRSRPSKGQTNRKAQPAGREPIHIPLTWLKFGIGIFLLPIAWVLSLALLNVFHAGTSGSVWKSAELVLFSSGLGLWACYYMFFPRPTKVYVFGHELTHAIFVICSGGKVADFKVSDDGGYILSNKTNTWISLSPYFVPIFSIVSLLSLTAVHWWLVPIPYFDRLLFFVTGVTWGFHLTFTLSMIRRGQSDLDENGTFFSLVLIYILNLVQIVGLLVLASKDVTLGSYFDHSLAAAGEFSRMVLRVFGIEG